MKIFLLFFSFIFFSYSLKCQEFKEYKFNWYPSIKVLNDDIIIFPDTSKYETYNTSGVWEDNFGNYGNMKCVIAQLISKQKDITLDGYCEAKDYEGQMFWISLRRNSFNKAGIGKGNYLFSKTKYKILQGKACPYAAQIIDGGGIFKLKCKLNKDEYKDLEKNKK